MAYSLDPYTFPALRKLWIVDSNMEEEVGNNFVKMTSEATDVLITCSKMVGFFGCIYNYPDPKQLWPRIKVMTGAVHRFYLIELYLKFARNRSAPFTLRLHHKLLSSWRVDINDEFDELEKLCTLDPISEEDWPIDVESFWPSEMETACHFDRDSKVEDPCYVDFYTIP